MCRLLIVEQSSAIGSAPSLGLDFFEIVAKSDSELRNHVGLANLTSA